MRFAQLIAAASLLAACSSRPTESSAGTPGISGANAVAALAASRWVLVELRSKPIGPGETAREPFITLAGSAEARFSGSTGCNEMFGSYALNGSAVRFGDIGATKIACDRGMPVESSFLTTLAVVAGWRIDRQHLELNNADGTVVARFEARAPK